MASSRKQRRALVRAAKRRDKKLRKAAWRSLAEGNERAGRSDDQR